MHKLPKDAALRTALLRYKTVIHEILHTFATISLLGSLTNPCPVFNKISPSQVR